MDITLIAHEPKRAETITCSPAYTGIEAIYLVRRDSDAISHAIGVRPQHAAAAAFLARLVEELRARKALTSA